MIKPLEPKYGYMIQDWVRYVKKIGWDVYVKGSEFQKTSLRGEYEEYVSELRVPVSCSKCKIKHQLPRHIFVCTSKYKEYLRKRKNKPCEECSKKPVAKRKIYSKVCLHGKCQNKFDTPNYNRMYCSSCVHQYRKTTTYQNFSINGGVPRKTSQPKKPIITRRSINVEKLYL